MRWNAGEDRGVLVRERGREGVFLEVMRWKDEEMGERGGELGSYSE